MDEKAIRLEARLNAIELLLARMFSALAGHLSDEDFQAALDGYRATGERLTIPGLDAAQSDVVAAEHRDQLVRLLDLVAKVRKAGG